MSWPSFMGPNGYSFQHKDDTHVTLLSTSGRDLGTLLVEQYPNNLHVLVWEEDNTGAQLYHSQGGMGEELDIDIYEYQVFLEERD